MYESERLHDLADFLRTRRARLMPSEVGIPVGLRRRTPGLRREEVAQLANIGTSWYTSLEQGRDVRPSEQVLESLARALRLNADERRHLFTLAQPPAPLNPSEEERVSPALHQMIQALDPNPAYVIGRRWDLLAWNSAAELVFAFGDILPPYGRNLIWRIFTSRALSEEHADGERIARGIIAQFRADSARYPGDPWFAQLVADLQQRSAPFRRFWAQHDVLSIPSCHKDINHPTLGQLEFEMTTLQEHTNSDLKLVVYMAAPATAAILKQRICVSEHVST
ncbi:MAG: helix-turn-helix transcriptional regulator [Roseiflexaceae bacterium]